jgi:hypothetical protein
VCTLAPLTRHGQGHFLLTRQFILALLQAFGLSALDPRVHSDLLYCQAPRRVVHDQHFRHQITHTCRHVVHAPRVEHVTHETLRDHLEARVRVIRALEWRRARYHDEKHDASRPNVRREAVERDLVAIDLVAASDTCGENPKRIRWMASEQHAYLRRHVKDFTNSTGGRQRIRHTVRVNRNTNRQAEVDDLQHARPTHHEVRTLFRPTRR